MLDLRCISCPYVSRSQECTLTEQECIHGSKISTSDVSAFCRNNLLIIGLILCLFIRQIFRYLCSVIVTLYKRTLSVRTHLNITCSRNGTNKPMHGSINGRSVNEIDKQTVCNLINIQTP